MAAERGIGGLSKLESRNGTVQIVHNTSAVRYVHARGRAEKYLGQELKRTTAPNYEVNKITECGVRDGPWSPESMSFPFVVLGLNLGFDCRQLLGPHSNCRGRLAQGGDDDDDDYMASEPMRPCSHTPFAALECIHPK